MWRNVTIACLLGCVSTAHIRDDRIRWEHEPIVGTSDPTLMDDVSWAVDQWEWGVAQAGCEGADICVRRGFAVANGPLGQAYWPGDKNPCDAVVNRPWREPVVVAHEIGHCYGLGHSQNSNSVMSASFSDDEDKMYWVTYDDAAALARIQNER